ncbi:hypothetical protein J2S36_000872 [Arcanobacterium hippocoleae]|uniref:Transposase n=1 Tax=Arcanobacterium hippocoleae TaxID=149017 RepID=A0ABU1T1U5_9ACTO|nr:hypothetical protein [Arcanobacterium hippocoleae]
MMPIMSVDSNYGYRYLRRTLRNTVKAKFQVEEIKVEGYGENRDA